MSLNILVAILEAAETVSHATSTLSSLHSEQKENCLPFIILDSSREAPRPNHHRQYRYCTVLSNQPWGGRQVKKGQSNETQLGYSGII